MSGISVIVKKELADHFSSYRFTIIFALIAMISMISAYKLISLIAITIICFAVSYTVFMRQEIRWM